jgi:hypothetical protein
MKVYTFLNDEGECIQTVRAEDYHKALDLANGWIPVDDPTFVTSETDFYSEEVEE